MAVFFPEYLAYSEFIKSVSRSLSFYRQSNYLSEKLQLKVLRVRAFGVGPGAVGPLVS